VVLTTHYIEEAERLADQVHIIDRGRLVVSGTPSELTEGGVRRLEDVFLDNTGRSLS
jgi:ABC-type multidrug transport system ATPase subunit